jgi:hypothetical protein
LRILLLINTACGPCAKIINGLLRNDGKMHELIARGTVHASTAHAPHPKRNLFMRAANFAHRHYSYRVCRSCSPNTLPSTGMHRVSPAIFLSICTSGFTSGSSCAARAFVLLLKSHPPCHDLLQASSAMRVTRTQSLSSAPRSRRDCHRSPLGRERRRLRLCVLHSIRQDVGLPARTPLPASFSGPASATIAKWSTYTWPSIVWLLVCLACVWRPHVQHRVQNHHDVDMSYLTRLVFRYIGGLC